MIPKKVIVVGAGGIGSHFIPVAARLLAYGGFEGDMCLMDGDSYEEKNQARQMFHSRFIGRNKALTQAEAVFDMPVTTVVWDKYLEGADEFAGMAVNNTHDWEAGDFLLVCLCVDNDATRRMVYDGLRETPLNFVIIDMANELHTGDVIICGRMGGDLMFPWPPEIYPNLANPGDRPPQAYCTQQAPSTPQIVTANMMAACLGAEYLRRLMDATNDSPLSSRVVFDLREPKMYGVKE